MRVIVIFIISQIGVDMLIISNMKQLEFLFIGL